MATAFISHASEDREVAERICSFLEERGIRCWIAPRDVRPGRRYGEEIVEGIHAADAVVLVLSENANTSRFVEREIERAVSYGKPTLPVRVREVQPSRSLELFISNAHWIDAWKPPMEQYLDRLADSIRSLSSEGPASTTVGQLTVQGKQKRKSTRTIAITGGIIALLAIGALAAWWFLARKNAPVVSQVVITTPSPTIEQPTQPPPPQNAVSPAPTIAEALPTPALATPRQQETPSPTDTPRTVPPVENAESPEPVVAQTHSTGKPSRAVADVLTSLGNTRGRARDEAIKTNLQRLPEQITVDEFLAVIEGTYARNDVIRELVNRLPNPQSIDDVLRILDNTTSRERSGLIEILESRMPDKLTVKDLLDVIEGSYSRNEMIGKLVHRLPNPLSVDEALRILGNTTSRMRSELIKILDSRLPGKLSVKDLLAVIEGGYARSELIQELLKRLPNSLSFEEILKILGNTASRERLGLIEMMDPRMPDKLSVNELLAVIEGTYDRNGAIKLLVNRLPNPISFEDMQRILGSTSSRERSELIQILAPRAARNLSSEQIAALIQGSYAPQETEKLLRR